MKTIIRDIALFCLFAGGISAQENQPVSAFKNGTTLGFQLGQFQNDFGFGLNVTSPFFAKGGMAVRVRGNLMYNQHVTPASETTWAPYGNISAGVVVRGGEIGNFMRLYGEGGLLAILPSSDFSSQGVSLGGYGGFGFEFFMTKFFNYYIEIGGVGTGATADKLPGKPIFSNGLLVQVGFRYTI
jgi:hypothetical protein